MKKLIILFFILILTLTLTSCKNSNSIDEDAIPWDDWSGSYSLTQIEYGFYDEKGWRQDGYTGYGKDADYWWIPEDERNFLMKCIEILGTTLWFEENKITFFGKELFTNEFSTSGKYIKEDFHFSFKENVFGEQTGDIKEYIKSGYARVGSSSDLRIIEINCSLYMPREERLDFKPVATFTLEYYSL